MPTDWLRLTTHRLDIYKEELAKVEFIEKFEELFNNHDSNNPDTLHTALNELPTAFDYIRLGHPLSCILEWTIAKLNKTEPDKVISFSSQTIAILAILRMNSLENKGTQIIYRDTLPDSLNIQILRNVYGYSFELKKIETNSTWDLDHKFKGSVIYLHQKDNIGTINLQSNIDFYIQQVPELGSIVLVNGKENESYIADIQHVRRRETIAMTPADALVALKTLQSNCVKPKSENNTDHKVKVLATINQLTGTRTKALVGSSGLSIQYAIMMGLIDAAFENHKGKAIKIIVPPNCYGGTNDQARRVAACLDQVEVVDLPVDGDHNMIQSVDLVLDKIAALDAVPFIIAEIPTNPRVEVPDLKMLEAALSKKRYTKSGDLAIDPVFILDQTFCPNVHFLGEGEILSAVKTIAYISGSKFPSGGLCTAGFCVSNKVAESLMDKIEIHLNLCDNEATDLQYEILAKQMPSMNQRINAAYKNTREFVNFISEKLPLAKINFVSEKLATQGFTPSVFSLDLPTKGNTPEEKEAYKRKLNHKLIQLMISEIPDESKHCVSYGQLKGCYWTIPATSTQGTTKERDKDYIARVALSPNMDLELHKKVFLDFVNSI